MKTKEEVIKEVYGDYYEECKPNENGWSYSANHQYYKFWELYPEEKVIDRQLYFRPIELKGIENNNSWIRILSGSDLPSEYTDCHYEHKNGVIGVALFSPKIKSFSIFDWTDIVAYRPIEIPPKRVY